MQATVHVRLATVPSEVSSFPWSGSNKSPDFPGLVVTSLLGM